jgi:hypothetical protein
MSPVDSMTTKRPLPLMSLANELRWMSGAGVGDGDGDGTGVGVKFASGSVLVICRTAESGVALGVWACAKISEPRKKASAVQLALTLDRRKACFTKNLRTGS